MKLKNALVVYYVHNYSTLGKVKKCLGKTKIKFRTVKRDDLTPRTCKNYDLIIVVGGDGTFLRTAHKIPDDTPIFPISSDTRYNEAFYSQATPKDFCMKLEKICKNEFKTLKLPRLQAKINGKIIKTLAVNEIFIGNSKPYHTSRYIIKIKGRKEFQKSSGLIITTRTGNTGWAKSASKKTLTIPKNKFGYVVREPYFGKLTKPKLVQGTLNNNETLKVFSEMHEGILVMDSSFQEHKFTDKFKAEIKISKKHLNIIGF